MTTPDTITQQTASPVTTPAGRKVKARRMAWGRAKELLKLIPKHLNEYAPLFFSKDAEGGAVSIKVDVLIPRLVEMIGSVEELADFVLEHGTDVTPEELASEITLHDALALIGAALEINMGADLKNSCASIAKTLSGLVSAQSPKKTPTAESTPTSADPVLQPTT